MNKKSIRRVFAYIPLILLAVVMIYPLLWMVASSLRDNRTIFTSVGIFVKNPNWRSYIDGWQSLGKLTFGTYFKNTFTIVIPVVVLTVLSSFLVGFGFARFRFPGYKILFSLMLSGILLPQEVLMVPKYIMFNKFGWLNSYKPFIIPSAFAVDSFFIFLFIQFIRGIPKELDEAAKIDGANTWTIIRRVIFPLCKPAVISAVIFQTVWRWNDFFTPLLYINSPSKYTLSLGLRLSLYEGEAAHWNEVMAMAVLSMLPVVILYAALQRYFVEGIATSGLKG